MSFADTVVRLKKLRGAQQGVPTKATKPPSEGFVGTGGRASENFNSDGAGLNGNSVPNVFEYRLTDSPSWLVFLAPGVDFNNARRILEAQFGEDRLVEIRPKHRQARKRKSLD